jgi:hypothetical protein
MNRRIFLRSLLGTSVIAAAPKVVYAFAPPGGWVLGQRVYSFKNVKGALAPSIFTRRLNETNTQLRARIACKLIQARSEFEVLDPKLVQALRTKRDKEWFL